MAIDFWTGLHSDTENLSGHNLVRYCNRPPALGWVAALQTESSQGTEYCYESVRAWPPILAWVTSSPPDAFPGITLTTFAKGVCIRKQTLTFGKVWHTKFFLGITWLQVGKNMAPTFGWVTSSNWNLLCRILRRGLGCALLKAHWVRGNPEGVEFGEGKGTREQWGTKGTVYEQPGTEGDDSCHNWRVPSK
jgi:DNA-binding transcriptional LysR family regulator